MENFIIILCLIVLGFILKNTQKFPENTPQVLNLFVIYVSLPALVLVNVPKLEFSSNLLVTAITPWIMLFVSVAIILAFAKLFKWDRETIGALLLIAPLGNTSFLGIPMVEAFFGKDAVGYAVMYDQFGSFFALAVYGSIVLAIYSGGSKQISAKTITKKIISFPPFISFFVALCLYSIALPPSYFSVLEPIAKTLIPVVIISVVFQLFLKVEFNKIRSFIVGLSVKMVFAPLLAFLTFMALGWDAEIYKVTVFEAAMPPMISAGALAIMANFSPRLVSAMIAYGILFSFITLPLWVYILNN